MRLVQPRLTAVGGVQKADILGGRTFAMRIWMKPDRMAALNISPAQVRKVLARNNFLSAVGNTKGSLAAGEPDGEHRSAHSGRFQEARHSPGERKPRSG